MFNLSLQRQLVEIWCESFRSLHVGIRNDFWTDSDKCVSRCVRSQHFWVVTSSGRSVVARQRANTVVVAKRESWVCRWRHARCSSYSLTSFRPLRRRPTATAHPVTQQIHLDTISSIYLLYWYTLMPNSHRRRDVTRKKNSLSSRVWRCELDISHRKRHRDDSLALRLTKSFNHGSTENRLLKHKTKSVHDDIFALRFGVVFVEHSILLSCQTFYASPTRVVNLREVTTKRDRPTIKTVESGQINVRSFVFMETTLSLDAGGFE